MLARTSALYEFSHGEGEGDGDTLVDGAVDAEAVAVDEAGERDALGTPTDTLTPELQGGST